MVGSFRLDRAPKFTGLRAAAPTRTAAALPPRAPPAAPQRRNGVAAPRRAAADPFPMDGDDVRDF